MKSSSKTTQKSRKDNNGKGNSETQQQQQPPPPLTAQEEYATPKENPMSKSMLTVGSSPLEVSVYKQPEAEDFEFLDNVFRRAKNENKYTVTVLAEQEGQATRFAITVVESLIEEGVEETEYWDRIADISTLQQNHDAFVATLSDKTTVPQFPLSYQYYWMVFWTTVPSQTMAENLRVYFQEMFDKYGQVILFLFGFEGKYVINIPGLSINMLRMLKQAADECKEQWLELFKKTDVQETPVWQTSLKGEAGFDSSEFLEQEEQRYTLFYKKYEQWWTFLRECEAAKMLDAYSKLQDARGQFLKLIMANVANDSEEYLAAQASCKTTLVSYTAVLNDLSGQVKARISLFEAISKQRNAVKSFLVDHDPMAKELWSMKRVTKMAAHMNKAAQLLENDLKISWSMHQEEVFLFDYDVLVARYFTLAEDSPDIENLEKEGYQLDMAFFQNRAEYLEASETKLVWQRDLIDLELEIFSLNKSMEDDDERLIEIDSQIQHLQAMKKELDATQLRIKLHVVKQLLKNPKDKTETLTPDCRRLMKKRATELQDAKSLAKAADTRSKSQARIISYRETHEPIKKGPPAKGRKTNAPAPDPKQKSTKGTDKKATSPATATTPTTSTPIPTATTPITAPVTTIPDSTPANDTSNNNNSNSDVPTAATPPPPPAPAALPPPPPAPAALPPPPPPPAPASADLVQVSSLASILKSTSLNKASSSNSSKGNSKVSRTPNPAAAGASGDWLEELKSKSVKLRKTQPMLGDHVDPLMAGKRPPRKEGIFAEMAHEMAKRRAAMKVDAEPEEAPSKNDPAWQ